VFMPQHNNDLIVGAVGVLQFEVVAYRLKEEYKVDSVYEPVNINTVRWRSEEHTSELQSRFDLVCRLLLEKKKKKCTLTSRRWTARAGRAASSSTPESCWRSSTGPRGTRPSPGTGTGHEWGAWSR